MRSWHRRSRQREQVRLLLVVDEATCPVRLESLPRPLRQKLPSRSSAMKKQLATAPAARERRCECLHRHCRSLRRTRMAGRALALTVAVSRPWSKRGPTTTTECLGISQSLREVQCEGLTNFLARLIVSLPLQTLRKLPTLSSCCNSNNSSMQAHLRWRFLWLPSTIGQPKTWAVRHHSHVPTEVFLHRYGNSICPSKTRLSSNHKHNFRKDTGPPRQQTAWPSAFLSVQQRTQPTRESWQSDRGVETPAAVEKMQTKLARCPKRTAIGSLLTLQILAEPAFSP
ncbi:hypothetical protein Q31b_47640 [Novipirellula aureliae]|uniref:Uncharacterized protein n=1 Tax=Novipirellula aureliae TaxID=2527966 RepID=A0A5C6DGS6_9BACT|nr:hypothetical protein Q31b_47640 [Novipirellula aureliae]